MTCKKLSAEKFNRYSHKKQRSLKQTERKISRQRAIQLFFNKKN